jgi:nicotinate-nucleotide--dimethylbenzimidazole phosphoribosyltransferase
VNEQAVSDLGGVRGPLLAPDNTSMAAVAARAERILRPTGALARLDQLAVWLAGWQRTTQPRVERPVALVFAADHGVAAAGVSAYPAEITASMLQAFRAGVSSINVMAAQVGARVDAIDVGVGRPTADLRFAPALDHERFGDAIAAGRAAVAAADADVLVLGEMGIGNTTAAAAVCAALCGGPSRDWVGRGTGVDDEGLARKAAAVELARERISGCTDPLEVLREVGGAELVALAAAIVEARARAMPVVLDGYVTAAAALPLACANPDALAHCVAGHRSAEPGHRRVLDRLGLEPLLDLGMRLGEGSGAMAAVPLLALACRLVTDVPTFDEWLGAADR